MKIHIEYIKKIVASHFILFGITNINNNLTNKTKKIHIGD